MQNVKIWLNWVFTWVFMLCSKQYISKIFYVKSLWPSSKTALFGFIHVDRILQIFYRSLLFSLPNLLGEMGVWMWEFRYEKSSTSDTLQSEAPESTSLKNTLCGFWNDQGCSGISSTRNLSWRRHPESLHLCGKVIAPEPTSPVLYEVCAPSHAPWVGHKWWWVEAVLALAGVVARSFTTTYSHDRHWWRLVSDFLLSAFPREPWSPRFPAGILRCKGTVL